MKISSRVFARWLLILRKQYTEKAIKIFKQDETIRISENLAINWENLLVIQDQQ